MATIWKFGCPPGNTTTRSMPAGARFLSAHVLDGEATMWFLVDTAAAAEKRRFDVIGSGWELPANGTYLATVHEEQAGRVLTWHIFGDRRALVTFRYYLNASLDQHTHLWPSSSAPTSANMRSCTGSRCSWHGHASETSGDYERCPECREPTYSPAGHVDGVRLVRALFSGGKP